MCWWHPLLFSAGDIEGGFSHKILKRESKILRESQPHKISGVLCFFAISRNSQTPKFSFLLLFMLQLMEFPRLNILLFFWSLIQNLGWSSFKPSKAWILSIGIRVTPRPAHPQSILHLGRTCLTGLSHIKHTLSHYHWQGQAHVNWNPCTALRGMGIRHVVGWDGPALIECLLIMFLGIWH